MAVYQFIRKIINPTKYFSERTAQKQKELQEWLYRDTKEILKYDRPSDEKLRQLASEARETGFLRAIREELGKKKSDTTAQKVG